MGREVKIPSVGGRYTMVRGDKIPWIGVDTPCLWVQNTMCRGVKIPWVGGRNAIFHGYVVKIPWVGGRFTMGRQSKYHG